VPFGVMSGYIIAAIMIGPSSGSDVCLHVLCWRWPLLVEWAILLPFCIAVHFVPSAHLSMNGKRAKVTSKPSVYRRRHSIAGTRSRPSYGSLYDSAPTSRTAGSEITELSLADSTTDAELMAALSAGRFSEGDERSALLQTPRDKQVHTAPRYYKQASTLTTPKT
jgi:hypothetical protein